VEPTCEEFKVRNLECTVFLVLRIKSGEFGGFVGNGASE